MKKDLSWDCSGNVDWCATFCRICVCSSGNEISTEQHHYIFHLWMISAEYSSAVDRSNRRKQEQRESGKMKLPVTNVQYRGSRNGCGGLFADK